jgi:phosphopantetheinyl transferase
VKHLGVWHSRAGPRGDVHVLAIADAPASLRALAPWILADDRLRARRIGRPARRRTFLLGRALLRCVLTGLTGVPASRQRLRLRRNRRPLHGATGRRRLALSTTNAGGWVLVAAAPGASAGRCLGIDVERRGRRPDARIARRLRPDREEKKGLTLEDWCRIEAVLKAEGRGLSALGRLERPAGRGFTAASVLDDRRPGRVLVMGLTGLPGRLVGALALAPRLGRPGAIPGDQVPRR